MKKIATCFESQKEKILSEREEQIIVSCLEVSIFCKWKRALSFNFEGGENQCGVAIRFLDVQ